MNRFSNQNIKHIFFDLDHTLWDFDTNSLLAFEEIFKEYFPHIEIQHFIKFYVPINKALWKLYQEDKISHQELRFQRLKQSFEKINHKISDDEIEFVANLYIDLLPIKTNLFENTFDVLDYLSDKYTLHIITNGFSVTQEKKLKNANLHNYFKTVTNSEMAGVKKPNGIIFEYALSLAKANKQEALMIGDCIEADVMGAKNVGMEAIWFNPNQESCPANILQITNLIELKNIL